MRDDFLAALPEAMRARYAAYPALDAVLAQLATAAGEPDVARFLADLAARLDPETEPAPTLAAIRAADLALAASCARGEPEALARFERELFGQVDAALARFRRAPITLDELRQAMRDRLFVAGADAAPRIASYRGRGDLRAWVRMVTVRYLVDVVRAESARPDRVGPEPELADVAIAGDDPELAFLKRQYRAEFRAAFAATLATLEPRDRNILRHRYLDGLEVAELASIYKLHRVSMSRTLARIREALLVGIRRELMQRLGVTPTEVDSIMALIGSRLEMSLSGLLPR